MRLVWNTGAIISDISTEDAYNAERGTRNGKECTSGGYCNDNVIRTTTWTGKVGLIYPSDYDYASTNTSCRNWINADTEDKRYCKNDNWLHNGTNYWTISPRDYSGNANSAWDVYSTGYVNGSYANIGLGVRPSVYLKTNVPIISGDGSSTNAYQLSM